MKDEELDPGLIAAAPGKTILSASAINILPPAGFSPDVDAALQDIDREGQVRWIGGGVDRWCGDSWPVKHVYAL